MSTTAKQCLPQKRRPPSARDASIFIDHTVHCRPQGELAAEHHLSKGRVSQIMKTVAAWRAEAGPADGELAHDPRRRLERGLAPERLEDLYAESRRMLREFEQPATSHRQGARDGKEWHEEATREQSAARIQALKSAMRAAEKLGDLAEREPLPPKSEGPSLDELCLGLVRRRKAAEEAGRVAAFRMRSRPFISCILHAIAGEELPYILDQDADSQAVRTFQRALSTLVGEPAPQAGVSASAGADGAKLAKPLNSAEAEVYRSASPASDDARAAADETCALASSDAPASQASAGGAKTFAKFSAPEGSGPGFTNPDPDDFDPESLSQEERDRLMREALVTVSQMTGEPLSAGVPASAGAGACGLRSKPQPEVEPPFPVVRRSGDPQPPEGPQPPRAVRPPNLDDPFTAADWQACERQQRKAYLQSLVFKVTER